MKKIWFTAFCLALFGAAFTQKHDNIWLSGYSGGGSAPDTFGITIMEFQEDDTFTLTKDQGNWFRLGQASVCISDGSGHLLFYSNGYEIWDRRHRLMKNGYSLNLREGGIGYGMDQGILALPYPARDSLWAFIHGTYEIIYLQEEVNFSMTNTWYSVINMNANRGNGEVILKMDTLSNDTLMEGRITACRHGNGRDWWIMLMEDCTQQPCDSTRFHQFLLTPEGLSERSVLTVEGNVILDGGVGQSRFTTDGSKFVYSRDINGQVPIFLSIYDFDRCTGELSNHVRIDIPVDGTWDDASYGMEISPNSRFVYVIRLANILQYDLWAEDIAASAVVVAEYDGFRAPHKTNFYLAQLAPNGKIYINTPSTTRYLHVINKPNEKGLACEVQQRAVLLPTLNGRSFPNNPNYRLYDLADSPCDTLGINGGNLFTSTEEVDFFPSVWVSVYPNPASEVVTVAFTAYQHGQLALYNVHGQQVWSGQLHGDTMKTIAVDHLPKGIYFLQLQLEGQALQSRKVLISR